MLTAKYHEDNYDVTNSVTTETHVSTTFMPSHNDTSDDVNFQNIITEWNRERTEYYSFVSEISDIVSKINKVKCMYDDTTSTEMTLEYISGLVDRATSD